MTVTVEIVLSEVAPFIPPYNVLSDEQMQAIAAQLIVKYGNDDSKLGTIKCEFLKIIGYQNSVISSITPAAIRSERVGDHQISYAGGGDRPDWLNYIKNVKEILCPLFGVENTITFGAKVNSSPRKPVISPCCSGCDDLTL